MKIIQSEEERKAVSAKLAELEARKNKMTPAERAVYEESWLYLSDYYNAIDSAVQETRAKAAYDFKRMVVANMHADGLSVSIISRYVELTEAEVLNIIQTLS